jgi:hypothetical protein
MTGEIVHLFQLWILGNRSNNSYGNPTSSLPLHSNLKHLVTCPIQLPPLPENHWASPLVPGRVDPARLLHLANWPGPSAASRCWNPARLSHLAGWPGPLGLVAWPAWLGGPARLIAPDCLTRAGSSEASLVLGPRILRGGRISVAVLHPWLPHSHGDAISSFSLWPPSLVPFSLWIISPWERL